MSTMTRFCRSCGLTSPNALPTIFSYWPTFGHENPPKVGDCERAASISIRVMRASAGDAASNAASDAMKVMPKARMLPGIAKKWFIDDSSWWTPPRFVLLTGTAAATLDRCYAAGFSGSTNFTAARAREAAAGLPRTSAAGSGSSSGPPKPPRSAFRRQLDLAQGRLQASGQLRGVVVCPEMHEEQPRLLGEHVAVQRRHLDPAVAQGPEHGVDLACDEHEVPGDRRPAAPGRLEVDGDARTHADGDRHSILHYRVGAGDVDRINTAVDVALDAERPIDCGGVDVERRRRRTGGRRRRQRGLAFGKACAQRGGELDGVAAAVEVHVHGCGRGAQQMVVQRRDLDAALDEFLHHGVDLFMQEHEVAHHHCLAAHFLECEIGAQGKSGSDRDLVEGDLQVAPPKTDAVDSAGQLRTGSAESLRDRGPVVVGCQGGG